MLGHPGWYIGLSIAFVCILLVVICVASILMLARKIGAQAYDVAVALENIGDNTDVLRAVPSVNDMITGVYGAVGAVRATFLEGGK